MLQTLVKLRTAQGAGFVLVMCFPGARGKRVYVIGNEIRLAFVTDDGSRIYGTPRNQKKTTCLGSQQSILFHRKKNNDSDMGNRLKSLNTLVIVIVFTWWRTRYFVFRVLSSSYDGIWRHR